MLKKGNDHFEVTHLEPKVDVCEKRYVFDAQAPQSATPATRQARHAVGRIARRATQQVLR